MSPNGPTNRPPPEERLLRLIRSQEPQSSTATSRADTGAAQADAARVGPMRGSRAAARGVTWARCAVGGLSLVLAVEIVSLIIQWTRPLPSVTVPMVGAASQAGPAPAPAPSQDMPSLAASAAHPLFTSPAVTPLASAGPRPAQSASSKMLAFRLTLIGLMLGNPAQAVIEDSQTKKTYFVSPGQMVVDGAVLEQVLDNHVILDLNGEKIDLTL